MPEKIRRLPITVSHICSKWRGGQVGDSWLASYYLRTQLSPYSRYSLEPIANFYANLPKALKIGTVDLQGMSIDIFAGGKKNIYSFHIF